MGRMATHAKKSGTLMDHYVLVYIYYICSNACRSNYGHLCGSQQTRGELTGTCQISHYLSYTVKVAELLESEFYCATMNTESYRINTVFAGAAIRNTSTRVLL